MSSGSLLDNGRKRGYKRCRRIETVSELSERLKILRERSGAKSLRAFDKKAGTPIGLAAMIVSGARKFIQAETAKKYAEAHGCDWVWLYDGSGKAPHPRKKVA